MLKIPMDHNNANLILYMEYRLRQLGHEELLGFFKIWSEVTGYRTVRDYYFHSPKQCFYINILTALNKLSEKHTLTVLAIYVEGYKQREVAKYLGVSASYVSALLRSALDLLRGYKLLHYFLGESSIEVKVIDGNIFPSSVDQLQKLNLKYLDVSGAIEMSLKCAGINCIGELSAKTLAEILAIRNIGVVAAEFILNKIIELYSCVGIRHRFRAGNLKILAVSNLKEVQRIRRLYCEE